MSATYIEIFDRESPTGVVRSEQLTGTNEKRDSETIAWILSKFEMEDYGARVVEYNELGLPVSAFIV